jgi:hypothetical protein
MHRFFSGAKTFELFSGNQTFKRRSQQFALAKQRGPTVEALAFEYLFFRRGIEANCNPKNCREIPGGVMTAFFEGVR